MKGQRNQIKSEVQTLESNVCFFFLSEPMHLNFIKNRNEKKTIMHKKT